MASSLRLLVQGPDGAPEVLLFHGDAVVIGRRGAGVSGIDLALGDPAVSRRHARISRSGRGLMIEDLGSLGGTWCGERRLGRRRRLADGEVVRIGEFQITARLIAEGPAPRRPPTATSDARAPSSEPPRVDVEPAVEERVEPRPSAPGWRRQVLVASAAILVAVLGGVALAGEADVAPPEHAPPPIRCREGERRHLEAWVSEAGAGPLRAAAGLGWAARRGCEPAAIEGALHRGLALAGSEVVATMDAPIRRLAAAGRGPRVVVQRGGERVRIDLDGPERGPWTLPGGRERRWAESGDGRIGASLAGPEEVDVVDLEAPEPKAARLRLEIAARALVVAPDGRSLAALSGAEIEIWRDEDGEGGEGGGWRRQEGGALARPPASGDVLALGLGGLISAREGSLWWQRPGVAARPLGVGIVAWSLSAGGDALITADATGALRRWAWARGRLRGAPLARLGEAPRGLCLLAGERAALLLGDRVAFVELGRRWRPGEALIRSDALAGEAVDRLLCDPVGATLVAVGERTGLLWQRPGEAAARRLRWAGGPSPALALVDDALIEGDARGRLWRWPVAGAGFDSAVIAGSGEGVGPRSAGGGWSALASDGAIRFTRPRPGGARASERAAVAIGGEIDALAIDPAGGRWLAAGRHEVFVGALPSGPMDMSEGFKRTAIGHRARGRALAASAVVAHGLDGPPLAVGFLDAGALAYAVDAVGGVVLWPSEALAGAGAPLRAWTGERQVSRVAAAELGSTLAIAERGGTIRVIRVDAGERVFAEHEGGVVALAVDPSGRWVASGGDDRRVLLARSDGGQSTTLRLDEVARALTFVGADGWMAYGTDRGVIAVLRPGARDARVIGRHGRSAPLALVADGDRRLISVGIDGSIWLWSLDPGDTPALRGRAPLARGGGEALAGIVHDAGARRIDRVARDGGVEALFVEPEALIAAACRVDGDGSEIVAEAGIPVPSAVFDSLCVR